MTTKPTAIPRFYGVDFVAEQLGVTKKSVYRWIDAGGASLSQDPRRAPHLRGRPSGLR